MNSQAVFTAALAVSILTSSCVLIRGDRADTLIASARAGNAEATRSLINKGYDVKACGFHGLTALMAAADKGNIEMCRLLLDRGADVNAHNRSGSVLMWAVESGNRELVVFLLRKGADPGWRNSMGVDAREFALTNNRPDLANLLKSKSKNKTP